MRYRYIIELLTYDGRIITRAINADDCQIYEGSILFKIINAEGIKNNIAVYPADKTIITNIEKLK